MVTVISKIKFITLYLVLQGKMALVGSRSGRKKSLKMAIPFILSVLLLTTPGTPKAEEQEWPWTFEGRNFLVTRNSEDNFSPAVASNGTLYLVVWHRNTASGLDIYGVLVNSIGNPVGDEIPICTAPNGQMFPNVTWDGENFFVVWQDRRSGKWWDVYGAWVTPQGKVLGQDQNPNGVPIVAGKLDRVSPVISFDGENYLVAWQGRRNQKTWNVYFAIVSKESGEVIDQKPVSQSLKDQLSPSVDFDGENYLIVWQDKRGGKFWDIYGARVTTLGDILGKKAFPISPIVQQSINGWDKWKPVLSWDKNSFLVIWTASRQDEWSLESKRVFLDGTVDLYDTTIERDVANKSSPAILWDEVQYLLVWEDEPESGSRILGVSVLPEPITASGPVAISSPDVEAPSLVKASKLGDEYLVVWQALDNDGHWQIYGQRLGLKKNLKPIGPL